MNTLERIRNSVQPVIYIAGPMRGIPDFNFPAFDAAQQKLEAEGYTVVSPAQEDRDAGEVHTEEAVAEAYKNGGGPWVRRDVEIIMSLTKERNDGIALLYGWEKSTGARAEIALAAWRGIQVVPPEMWGCPTTASANALEFPSNTAVAEAAAAFSKFEEDHLGVQRCDAPQVNQETALVRTFSGGATREADTDKLDFEGFFSPAVMYAFGFYMHQHQKQADGQMRASDNWQSGMPRAVLMKSFLRHAMELWFAHRNGVLPPTVNGRTERDPQDIEDVLCALMFNVQAYLHECLLDRDRGKETA